MGFLLICTKTFQEDISRNWKIQKSFFCLLSFETATVLAELISDRSSPCVIRLRGEISKLGGLFAFAQCYNPFINECEKEALTL